MNLLEKNETLIELFAFYKNLLTDKQVEYFEMYYHLDYSFQEIADSFSISRNAVFDALKKVEENLNNYEEKLGLVKQRRHRQELIIKYEETKNSSFLEELKRMDE